MSTPSQTFPGTSVRSFSSSSRSLSGTVALWILQLFGAVMFLIAGWHKLSGDPMMVSYFEALGFGQWFRVLTGGIEVVAAVLLLIPRAAVFGAALLVPTMIGAVISHAVLGGSATMALVLLIAMSATVWFRRNELTPVLARFL